MDNLEYLEKIRKEDTILKDIIKDSQDNISISNFDFKYRQTKALEIITETLIKISDNINRVVIDGKVINVDTHEV